MKRTNQLWASAGELSRGAARDGSPRRKPWVAAEWGPEPRSGERTIPAEQTSIAPAGAGVVFDAFPTAYAVGYPLPPLRGCASMLPPKTDLRPGPTPLAGRRPRSRPQLLRSHHLQTQVRQRLDRRLRQIGEAAEEVGQKSAFAPEVMPRQINKHSVAHATVRCHSRIP